MIHTEKFTDESDIEVTVHFDDLKYQYLNHDPEERNVVYECRGYDANGREYSGIASFTCDELDGIEDIERIEKP